MTILKAETLDSCLKAAEPAPAQEHTGAGFETLQNVIYDEMRSKVPVSSMKQKTNLEAKQGHRH